MVTRKQNCFAKNIPIYILRIIWNSSTLFFFKTIEQGTVGPVEVTGKKKDGTRMPLLLNSVCILNEDGKPIYVVASMIEISEMKKNRKNSTGFRNPFPKSF